MKKVLQIVENQQPYDLSVKIEILGFAIDLPLTDDIRSVLKAAIQKKIPKKDSSVIELKGHKCAICGSCADETPVGIYKHGRLFNHYLVCTPCITHNTESNVYTALKFKDSIPEGYKGPIITGVETCNTGGGCMITYVDVQNCGNVEQFGIDEEYINAYSTRYQDCESNHSDYCSDTFNNEDDLIDFCGLELTTQLIDIHITYCSKYNLNPIFKLRPHR